MNPEIKQYLFPWLVNKSISDLVPRKIRFLMDIFCQHALLVKQISVQHFIQTLFDIFWYVRLCLDGVKFEIRFARDTFS